MNNIKNIQSIVIKRSLTFTKYTYIKNTVIVRYVLNLEIDNFQQSDESF